MKKRYLALIILLLPVLTACQFLQDDDEKEWATVEFTIQDTDQSEAQYSTSESTKTVLILAVPKSVASVSISDYVPDYYYSSQILDQTHNVVSLRTPLDTEIRLVKVVVLEDLTLDQFINDQPTAFCTGISAILYIKTEERSKTVDIFLDMSLFRKTITSFKFLAANNSVLTSDVEGTISGTDISATVPYGTDVAKLVATFSIEGKSLTVESTVQTSGTTANDFSSAVAYTVTAMDGSSQIYTVTVYNTGVFTDFRFEADINSVLSSDVSGTIDNTAYTIGLTVPNGTDVTALVATFATTGFSVTVNSETQTSGTTTNDFSGALTYTITAADGTTQDYTVAVSVIGFTISSISGHTSEGGTQATFTAKLNTQPSADVTIGISSSDTSEGTVDKSSLTFTSSNWNVDQTVTVTGVHDIAADGDQGFSIVLAAAGSSDPNYDGLDPSDVSVTNAAVSSATGSLDTSFNSTGYTVHHSAAGGNNIDEGYAIVIDSDGKILVSGRSHNGSNYDMALWRYNTDGSLDTTFNSTGYATHHNAAGGNTIDESYAVTIDSTGKIIVSGRSHNGSNYDMVIWRYNTDGSLDTTFNSTGYTTHHNAAGGNSVDESYAVTIDSSNKILVSGRSHNGSDPDMAIWRYNTDGSLDTTFNTTGYTTHHNAAGGNSSDEGYAMTIDSNGKILVAGISRNSSVNDDMVIWRCNTDGSLDTTFNSTGFTSYHNAAGGNGADLGKAITIDSDGKILVAGYSNNGSNEDMVIWRYNTDGSLDTSFNTTGYTVHHNAAGGNSTDYGDAITIDSNGKILVAGLSYNGASYDMTIWFYNTNGSLDTTFNTTGIAYHDNAAGGSSTDYGDAITIDSNGKILVSGRSHNGSNYDMAIWRYK